MNLGIPFYGCHGWTPCLSEVHYQKPPLVRNCGLQEFEICFLLRSFSRFLILLLFCLLFLLLHFLLLAFILILLAFVSHWVSPFLFSPSLRTRMRMPVEPTTKYTVNKQHIQQKSQE